MNGVMACGGQYMYGWTIRHIYTKKIITDQWSKRVWQTLHVRVSYKTHVKKIIKLLWFYHAHAFVLSPYFFNIKIILKYDILYALDKYVCMHGSWMINYHSKIIEIKYWPP